MNAPIREHQPITALTPPGRPHMTPSPGRRAGGLPCSEPSATAPRQALELFPHPLANQCPMTEAVQLPITNLQTIIVLATRVDPPLAGC